MPYRPPAHGRPNTLPKQYPKKNTQVLKKAERGTGAEAKRRSSGDLDKGRGVKEASVGGGKAVGRILNCWRGPGSAVGSCTVVPMICSWRVPCTRKMKSTRRTRVARATYLVYRFGKRESPLAKCTRRHHIMRCCETTRSRWTVQWWTAIFLWSHPQKTLQTHPKNLPPLRATTPTVRRRLPQRVRQQSVERRGRREGICFQCLGENASSQLPRLQRIVLQKARACRAAARLGSTLGSIALRARTRAVKRRSAVVKGGRRNTLRRVLGTVVSLWNEVFSTREAAVRYITYILRLVRAAPIPRAGCDKRLCNSP